MCRTRVMSNINGPEGGESRGNIAPVSINLPRLGLRSSNISIFWNLLQETLELCERQLLHRHETLKMLKMADLPLVATEECIMGSEGADLNDSIEEILKNGTYAIGYIGLAETLIALTGKHHAEDKSSHELGLEICKYISDFCERLTEKHGLNFSAYQSPAEGLSGRFTGPDRERFGVIKGITDKDHYTNSVHTPVDYKISIADKIQVEAPFHKYGKAGNILYIELDGYPTAETIEDIVLYAIDNSVCEYIAINFHIRQCSECVTFIDAEVDNCPKCNSDDIHGVTRITGYLALDHRMNKGKVDEKKRRISHTSGKLVYSHFDK